jgi:proline utilization trans-activator
VALEQGMHTNMTDNGLDDAHVQRCLNVWWTVYILDTTFSSLMGLPLAVKDTDIRAPLPKFGSSPQRALALDLHVQLTRITAQILNSTSVVRSLAEADMV